jgi:hypothetical protein
MATNILNLTAADAGKTLPLRGDMGVALNFTPADNHFRVAFMTQDAGTFIIGSTTRMFRALNLTAQSSLSVGGKVGLFIELMYDIDKGEFVVTKNNLTAADSGAGGSTGTAATITVAQTVTGAAGTAALVENIGTTSAVQLKFTIPRGDAGAAGTGGSGTTLPSGGTTAQYLGKTGNADGQVGWITLPAVSGGSGTGTGIGTTPEVLLTQNAQGEITPDKALGNAFRVLITLPLVIKNPVGYGVGEAITIAVRQGPNAPYPTPTWGLDYAHPDRQVPVFPSQPGALSEVYAKYTDAIDVNNPAGWMTRVTPTGSSIGYGVPSFMSKNVTTGVSYYFMRNPNGTGALTEIRPGQTVKILRNARGIEAYGAIDASNGAGNYLITGVLANGNRAELRSGPGVRTAFDRGVLAFGAGVTVTVQDLIISGAREQSGVAHIAQGVSVTDNSNVTLKNVRLYDNENGILSGNTDYTGTLNLIDCEFDANGVGDFGFTHNIYMGHNNGTWTATRCTFKNAVGGHNIKSRQGNAILNQVLCSNSPSAREMDMPNGGQVHATNCRFEHLAEAIQNDCIRIGAEGVDTSRPREYIFRNCHFYQGKPAANQASFIWNEDPDVDVQCIDCTFEAPNNPGFQWASSNAQGMIGRVVVSFTPGVTPGPLLPVGYQTIATTPVAG